MKGIMNNGMTTSEEEFYFIKGYNKARAEVFNEIMPILIDIVDTEGCCYGYEQEIDRLEYEWKKLKDQK